jgi:glutathione S-transferase
MILIGMFDSPFVRRVAVTLNLLAIPFEHRNWSVGKDFDRIREFNPLGRVPTLVLDDGEALLESAAILDYLDDLVGPARALLPPTGRDRRQALRIMSIAVGAAEKGVLQVYESVFRPEEKRHEPWVERCRVQMHGALAELERMAAGRADGWLIGGRMTQADITASCVFTFLSDAVGVRADGAYPGLAGLTERCERLPEFRGSKLAFEAPSGPSRPS